MKKHRKLLLILAVVLSVAIAAGSTMAYLQDTDEDVNVMTLGNVYITQNEQERNDEGDLVQFTQGKPMYPAVYEGDSYPADLPENWPVANNGAWEMTEQNENVIDKIVTVTNTGKSPAYVRTYIAFEGIDSYGPEGGCVHIITNGSNVGNEIAAEYVGTTQVNGVDYTVYAYTYLQPLDPGETTIPSLKQVYLDKNAGNEEVAHYGETYDILVYSQAVQAEGFADAQTALDEAFGKPAVTNVLWDDVEIPKMIYTYEELKEAAVTGGKYVIGADFDMPSYLIVRNGLTLDLDLNGHTLTSTRPAGSGNMYAFVSQEGHLNITGEGTVISERGLFVGKDNTTLVVNGGNYQMTPTNEKCHVYLQNSAKLIINDGVFTTTDESAALMYCINGFIEINGGFFQNLTNKNAALLSMGNNLSYVNNQKITISGGTFVNWNPMDSAFARPWTNPDVPALIVLADGCEVVSETQDNGDVWYTVVKK